MPAQAYKMQDFVIPNGTAVSNNISSDRYRFADRFLIGAPSALTGTITIEISIDGGTTYHTLQSAGSDITLGAGDITVVLAGGWDNMRIASSGNEGAERTFEAKFVEESTPLIHG